MGSDDWDKIRKEIPEDELEDIKQLGLSDEGVLEFLTLFRPSEVEIIGGTLDGDTGYLNVKMVSLGPEPLRWKNNIENGFVEGFYNPYRLHSSLGYVNPDGFERKHARQGQRAA